MNDQDVSTSTTPGGLVPTVVLYDIMCEAATRVHGALIGLYDVGVLTKEDCLKASLALSECIETVDPDDRDAIATVTRQARAHFATLDGYFDTDGECGRKPFASDQ